MTTEMSDLLINKNRYVMYTVHACMAVQLQTIASAHLIDTCHRFLSLRLMNSLLLI